MKTRIYYIRHGQSEGNARGILLGHTNIGLTQLGRDQAYATAKALAGVDFSAVYSSDLVRAYETAKPHADMRSLEVVTDARLREMYCGDWEYVPKEELVRRYGEMYTVAWSRDFGTFRMPGGESTQEGADRMWAAMEDMVRRHEGGNIVCASHGAVLRALFGRIRGIAPEDVAKELPYPANASYSIVECEDGKFKLASFSEDAHLEGMHTTWKD